MLKDEIEQDKQNIEKPSEGFYKYAISNLTDSSSWINSIVSSVTKSKQGGRSDDRGLYDEKSEKVQSTSNLATSDLTLQKKTSKTEEASFYEDIPMQVKQSGKSSSKDNKNDQKSGKKSKQHQNTLSNKIDKSSKVIKHNVFVNKL